jgi:hypothetical protein
MARRRLPGDGVGIQVPVGQIGADRTHWQTIFDARDKPSIYRIHNGSTRGAADPGNAMIVEVDGAKRTIKVNVGTSVDVMGKRIASRPERAGRPRASRAGTSWSRRPLAGARTSRSASSSLLRRNERTWRSALR